MKTTNFVTMEDRPYGISIAHLLVMITHLSRIGLILLSLAAGMASAEMRGASDAGPETNGANYGKTCDQNLTASLEPSEEEMVARIQSNVQQMLQSLRLNKSRKTGSPKENAILALDVKAMLTPKTDEAKESYREAWKAGGVEGVETLFKRQYLRVWIALQSGRIEILDPSVFFKARIETVDTFSVGHHEGKGHEPEFGIEWDESGSGEYIPRNRDFLPRNQSPPNFYPEALLVRITEESQWSVIAQSFTNPLDIRVIELGGQRLNPPPSIKDWIKSFLPSKKK